MFKAFLSSFIPIHHFKMVSFTYSVGVEYFIHQVLNKTCISSHLYLVTNYLYFIN